MTSPTSSRSISSTTTPPNSVRHLHTLKLKSSTHFGAASSLACGSELAVADARSVCDMKMLRRGSGMFGGWGVGVARRGHVRRVLPTSPNTGASSPLGVKRETATAMVMRRCAVPIMTVGTATKALSGSAARVVADAESATATATRMSTRRTVKTAMSSSSAR